MSLTKEEFRDRQGFRENRNRCSSCNHYLKRSLDVGPAEHICTLPPISNHWGFDTLNGEDPDMCLCDFWEPILKRGEQ